MNDFACVVAFEPRSDSSLLRFRLFSAVSFCLPLGLSFPNWTMRDSMRLYFRA